MMFDMSTPIRNAATAVVALIVGLAGILTGSQLSQIVSRGGADPNGAGPIAGARAERLIELSGEAFDLAYDSQSDRIWLAVLRVQGDDELVAVDAVSSRVSSWRLPDADYNGFLTSVVVGPNGIVYVGEPYRLVRFNPATEEMTSIGLTAEVPGASTDALDPNNPLPGTWVSAIAVSADAVLVGRNNVPYLSVYTPELETRAQIEVPAALAGPQDLAFDGDGSIWAISSPTSGRQAVHLTQFGDVIESVAGGPTEFGDTEDGLVMSGSGERLSGGDIENKYTSTAETDDSRSAAYGDWVITYDAAKGRIELSARGSLIGQFEFPAPSVTLHNPAEDSNALIRARVNDVAIDKRGSVWYLDGRAHTLVELAW